MSSSDRPRVVVGADPPLHARLDRLAREARLVFFAGLPGTGKSLLTQQLAHLAHAAGRVVHLLQWDVARPVFETGEILQRYPAVDGVTHPILRKAVGLWARRALVAWDQGYRSPVHLLIGETPFVGHRLIELARRGDDEAEALLAAPSCRFVIPVPSREVRRHLEAERERRAARPLHPRETEDASPSVLRQMWWQLAVVARTLGVIAEAPDAPYDPDVYRRVYERLLSRRRAETIALTTVLPTSTLSVYDFGVERRDLTPTPEEAAACLREVEACYPDAALLDREVARWHEV